MITGFSYIYFFFPKYINYVLDTELRYWFQDSKQEEVREFFYVLLKYLIMHAAESVYVPVPTFKYSHFRA